MCLPFLQFDASFKVDFNKEKGYVAILDKSGKARLVYSSPIVQIGNKTVTLPIEWEPQTNSISVTLPTDSAPPVIVAFGLATKIPKERGSVEFSFPSFKFGTAGEVGPYSDSESSEEESEEEDTTSKQKGIKVWLHEKKKKITIISAFLAVLLIQIPFVQTLSCVETIPLWRSKPSGTSSW